MEGAVLSQYLNCLEIVSKGLGHLRLSGIVKGERGLQGTKGLEIL